MNIEIMTEYEQLGNSRKRIESALNMLIKEEDLYEENKEGESLQD